MPSRLFEYLYLEKPIIAIVKRATKSAGVIEGNQLGHVLEEVPVTQNAVFVFSNTVQILRMDSEKKRYFFRVGQTPNTGSAYEQ